MEDALYRGNHEPTLDQILAEPIIQTIMRRDGVDEDAIRRLMSHAARVTKPPEAKPRFILPMPPAGHDNAKPPRASIGVLAQAAAQPPWPRVFPSL